MKGMGLNMNNKNWIAVFLGLACLVLFVSVMGVSNNWTGKNSTMKNNNSSPQQINQTINRMDNGNSTQNNKMPEEIDASGLTSQITNNGNTSGINNMENMSKISY